MALESGARSFEAFGIHGEELFSVFLGSMLKKEGGVGSVFLIPRCHSRRHSRHDSGLGESFAHPTVQYSKMILRPSSSELPKLSSNGACEHTTMNAISEQHDRRLKMELRLDCRSGHRRPSIPAAPMKPTAAACPASFKTSSVVSCMECRFRKFA